MAGKPRSARRRWLLSGLGLYGLLLGASHLVRAARPFEPVLGAGDRVAEVSEIDGAAPLARPVRIAYRDIPGPIDKGEATPVLLLHGSPGSKDDFRGVTDVLARARRVLAPDLPGFGASEPRVADYSVRAHARYASQLLDALSLERVHVVGFSMGGGVAIELAAWAPERVASVVLLSSIGVQELELFGDHDLNHAAHALQLGLVRALEEGLPHFGALDGSFFGRAYARNFFDTDQRPLRAALELHAGPLLVLHGAEDFLVPVAAAREHARIVPQSEIELFAGGHFLLFDEGAAIGTRLETFFARVDGGAVEVRASAQPNRVLAALVPFDPASLPSLEGPALLVFGLFAAALTLVSEDLACIGVGALVGAGRVPFLAGTLACFLGILLGDLLLFLAGRTLGRAALGRAPLSWFLSDDRVKAASIWVEARGARVILLSRFLPGARLPTYFAAGLLHTSLWRFTAWFALACALWTPALVFVSSQLGGALADRLAFFREHALLALSTTVALVLFVTKVLVPLASWRGRRLLYGRWLRLVRWEYWPIWVFYPPIVLSILRRAVEHRSALVFTAANPCMPAGGFVGESKGDILAALAGARDLVPAMERLPSALAAEERWARFSGFTARHGLSYPVVLKPDRGQRGEGVRVVRSADEARGILTAAKVDMLAQAFVPGVEYGVFYARHPEDACGRVFSITHKVLPSVVGDGVHTLERLILMDPRSLAMARVHLAHQTARLAWVPAAGERVALGDLGTHCRGATFLDGRDVLTSALEESVERLSRSAPGFCFGRYDLRAASREELMAGRFQVIELNGVTSEAAHIYDPRYGVRFAWRTLAEQWRLAFAIGAANVRRGARATSAAELAQAILRFWRRERLS